MQVCTSLQTDNHASIPPLSFLQAGCPSWRSCCPTNSIKALKAMLTYIVAIKWLCVLLVKLITRLSAAAVIYIYFLH